MEPWAPVAVTKVCHLETVRGKGRDEEEGGMVTGGGSTEQLTDGLGLGRE